MMMFTSLKRQWRWLISSVLVLGIIVFFYRRCSPSIPPSEPTVSVVVATAASKAFSVSLNALGIVIPDTSVAARTDIVQAQSQLETAQSQAIHNRIHRAQFEHAIAVLCRANCRLQCRTSRD